MVILTDSLPTLETLEHWNNTKYQTAFKKYIGLREILNDRDFRITLKWIPSQMDVDENWKVDQRARETHQKEIKTHCPLSTEDGKRKVKIAQERV